jgi:ribonucleotide reductase alpha subunit
MEQQMQVTKRDGDKEDVSFDKILTRLRNLSTNINPKLNITYAPLVMKVIDQFHDGITTNMIDELVAEQCASMSTTKIDYGDLAARIVVSNHQKSTSSSFSDTMSMLYNFTDHNGASSPIISDDLYNIVLRNAEKLDAIIDYDRDFLIDYFGFKTLERAYLIKVNDKIVERPQHLWLRVSLGIHLDDVDAAIQTYHLMSQKYFTHATPTLFNSGTPRPQLSSCYLIAMESDSIDGIYNTLKECAQISKWAGGIGLHIHNVRGRGTHIRGTNGSSNGLTPMLQVFNATARYVDQGGGKRNGSFAVYLEPWHNDIIDWLDLKKNHGDEALRARDLFYGLWVPDLFMEAVKNDKYWYLMCPDVCQGLSETYGETFNKLYNSYVDDGKFTKKIKARELWFKILDSQMETGTPYLLYKDAANLKSNQQNLGTIKSSNLCTEIIEYSDKDQTAVCNLASIGLPMFVNDDKTFNFDKLHEIAKIVTSNLNKVIDINYYPTEKTERSNLLHRPIGIGIQGLADVFAMMDLPFASDEAKDLNKKIFETIYHASLEMSMELSKKRDSDMRKLSAWDEIEPIFPVMDRLNVKRNYCQELGEECREAISRVNPIIAEIIASRSGAPAGAYSSFLGSPLSKGRFQFDLWDVTPSDRYDWEKLKLDICKYGTRNSLLVAPMPTASTSQILGNNECFEPFTSNIYTRRTIAGEFVVVNRHLIKELTLLGIWSEELKDSIIANKGSVQHIKDLPDNIKEKYKIVWEIPMKDIIDMSADRGAFICQSQSLNLWMEDPNYKSLTSMHFYSWQKKLKTGMYYLRRKPRHQPQQFTIDPNQNDDIPREEEPCLMCSA